MTKAEFKRNFRQLSPEDQLEVYSELGEELAPATDFRLPPQLQEMLEGRISDAKANPDGGLSVGEVHARVRASLTK